MLSYPPGWHEISGDPGTASGGLIVGYLNATPATSANVRSSWAWYRVDHNGEEGDRHLQLIAQAGDLRFLTGTGSCVADSYQASASGYTEIARLLRGQGQPTVIVAAATSSAWAEQQAVMHTAIAGFRTPA